MTTSEHSFKRQRPRPLRHAAAFTLIEVMVVLVIIALLVGLVAPRYGRLPAGMRERKALGELGLAFRDAATRSRATGLPVMLKIDAEGNRLRVEEVPDAAVSAPAASASPTPPATAPASTDGEPPARRFTGPATYPMPNGVEWHFEKAQGAADALPGFIFYPNGEAAGERLEFTAGRSQYTLDVDRLTGRVVLAEAR